MEHPKSKSTEGFNQPDGSPCKIGGLTDTCNEPLPLPPLAQYAYPVRVPASIGAIREDGSLQSKTLLPVPVRSVDANPDSDTKIVKPASKSATTMNRQHKSFPKAAVASGE